MDMNIICALCGRLQPQEGSWLIADRLLCKSCLNDIRKADMHNPRIAYLPKGASLKIITNSDAEPVVFLVETL